MSARPWTEAHRREARRRLRELSAELDLDVTAVCAVDQSRSEALFRQALVGAVPNIRGNRRVNREVARVRGLAEGRLVLETTWHVRMIAGNLSCAMTQDSARDMWRHALTTQGVVVRVTRIRRATP